MGYMTLMTEFKHGMGISWGYVSSTFFDLACTPMQLPSGKRLHSYGKSPSLIGKSTISMGHFQ